MLKKNLSLEDISLQQTCIVKKIQFCDAKLQRFRDLGIIVGCEMIPVFSSIFGDPRAYLVSDAIYAIRNRDAHLIRVKLKNPDAV